jgi:hypothetical protein
MKISQNATVIPTATTIEVTHFSPPRNRSHTKHRRMHGISKPDGDNDRVAGELLRIEEALAADKERQGADDDHDRNGERPRSRPGRGDFTQTQLNRSNGPGCAQQQGSDRRANIRGRPSGNEFVLQEIVEFVRVVARAPVGFTRRRVHVDPFVSVCFSHARLFDESGRAGGLLV